MPLMGASEERESPAPWAGRLVARRAGVLIRAPGRAAAGADGGASLPGHRDREWVPVARRNRAHSMDRREWPVGGRGSRARPLMTEDAIRGNRFGPGRNFVGGDGHLRRA